MASADGALTNGEAERVVGMLAGIQPERVVSWALVVDCTCDRGCMATAVVSPYHEPVPVVNMLATGITHVTLAEMNGGVLDG